MPDQLQGYPIQWLPPVFEHYYRELLSCLCGKVYDRDTAADLTQESHARLSAAQQAGTAIRD